jgi:SAM-dependent methyltransferase
LLGSLVYQVAMLDDVIVPLSDFAAWAALVQQRPEILNPSEIAALVAYVEANGAWSRFWGGGVKAEVVGPNYREALVANGLNSRQRAVLELVAEEPWFPNIDGIRIFAPEAVTQFARVMRQYCLRFLGSEFCPSADMKDLYPIPHEDLQALSFPDETWDCILTNDCLEHVPDIDKALAEMARVLRQNGVMLSTFPFTFLPTGQVRARLSDGEIEYLCEPEYHINPIDPKGSLVYETPGWDIIDRARSAGFSRAEMVLIGGQRRAIVSVDVAGVLVLRCYR